MIFSLLLITFITFNYTICYYESDCSDHLKNCEEFVLECVFVLMFLFIFIFHAKLATTSNHWREVRDT